jgi:hypothetical protein
LSSGAQYHDSSPVETMLGIPGFASTVVQFTTFERCSAFVLPRDCIEDFIHDKIKSILNKGKACYHSVQNLCLYILPLVLYECETWFVILWGRTQTEGI